MNNLKKKHKDKLQNKLFFSDERTKLAEERTNYADERTLLSQIRTASIFIGISGLIFFKFSNKKKYFHNLVVFILFLIVVMNSLSIFSFYYNIKKLKKSNIVSIAYGLILNIFILIGLFYIIYDIKIKKL